MITRPISVGCESGKPKLANNAPLCIRKPNIMNEKNVFTYKDRKTGSLQHSQKAFPLRVSVQRNYLKQLGKTLPRHVPSCMQMTCNGLHVGIYL